MIKHVVMWKLSPGVEPGDPRLAQAATDLAALVGVVPGLLDLSFGADLSRQDASWDMALSSTHESAQALGAYQAHPAHLAVIELLQGVFAERAVVDFQG